MRFTRHARNRQRLHGLSRTEVAEAATSIVEAGLDADGNLRLVGLTRERRRIVVVIAADDPDLVITNFPEQR